MNAKPKKIGRWSTHARTHGMSKTRVFKSWAKMKDRCGNPNNIGYADYGGRGIGYCKEWDSFEKFFEEMGNPPTPKHTLDRVDNSLSYCKANCKWSTGIEQGRNKRNNVILTHQGISQTLSDWSRQTSIKVGTLWKRIKMGWPDSRIITAPLRKMKSFTRQKPVQQLLLGVLGHKPQTIK